MLSARKSIQVPLAVVLTLGVLVVPSAEANKKPPIPFSSCTTPADQAGRTYRMTTGTLCTSAKDGVTVTANDVTIDLGGFTLTGGSAHNGILISPGVNGTHIKHGTITKFATGINGDTSSTGTVVSGINVISSGNGIVIGPGTVRNSTAVKDGIGIEILGTGVSGAGLITGSLATRDSIGMEIAQLATGVIDHSLVVDTTNRGIIIAARTSTVRRSTVSGNGSDGIDLTGAVRNTVDRVRAESNGGQGVLFGTGSVAPTLTRSTIVDNGRNGTSGFDMGVLITPASGAVIVTSNTVDGSFGDGIVIPTAFAFVDGNTANGNGWGAPGDNLGINAPNGHGHNHAAANDADPSDQCVDDTLC